MAWSEDDDIALSAYADAGDTAGILRDYAGRIAEHSGGDVSIKYNPDGSSVLNVLDAKGHVISSSPTDVNALKLYVPTVFAKAIQPERVSQPSAINVQRQRQQNNSYMNPDMIQNLMGGSGFAPSSAAETPGAALTDSSAPFGPAGRSSVTPGTASTGDDSAGMFGADGSLGGGWASAAGGALAGYMQGRKNYEEDPNMWNQKDDFGTAHKDYRAEVGGGFLGGVMGYYGGPVGAALAGPTTKVVHKYAEPATREVINFGDKMGGSSGALALDPIGTVASGKYSWGELAKGAFLGPVTKLFK